MNKPENEGKLPPAIQQKILHVAMSYYWKETTLDQAGNDVLGLIQGTDQVLTLQQAKTIVQNYQKVDSISGIPSFVAQMSNIEALRVMELEQEKLRIRAEIETAELQMKALVQIAGMESSRNSRERIEMNSNILSTFLAVSSLNCPKKRKLELTDTTEGSLSPLSPLSPSPFNLADVHESALHDAPRTAPPREASHKVWKVSVEYHECIRNLQIELATVGQLKKEIQEAICDEDANIRVEYLDVSAGNWFDLSATGLRILQQQTHQGPITMRVTDLPCKSTTVDSQLKQVFDPQCC